MNGKQRVYLVDQDLNSIESIGRLIRAFGYAVETYQSGNEFLGVINSRNGFCVILDVNMPDVSGLDLQQILNSRGRNLPIIFIAESASIPISVQAMKAGAVDFFVKPPDPNRLLVAIQESARKYLEAQRKSAAQDQFNSLTTREQEVFTLVATGMLNKQIAAHLGIAEKTIKVHRGRVMKKMKIQSVADLVRLSEKLPSTSAAGNCFK